MGDLLHGIFKYNRKRREQNIVGCENVWRMEKIKAFVKGNKKQRHQPDKVRNMILLKLMPLIKISIITFKGNNEK